MTYAELKQALETRRECASYAQKGIIVDWSEVEDILAALDEAAQAQQLKEDLTSLDEKVNDLSEQLSRRAEDIETEVRNAKWEADRAQKAESELSALQAQLAEKTAQLERAEALLAGLLQRGHHDTCQSLKGDYPCNCGFEAGTKYFAAREKANGTEKP